MKKKAKTLRFEELGVGHEVPLSPVAEAILRELQPRIAEVFDSEKAYGYLSHIGPQAIRVGIAIGQDPIAEFELEQMPGCCAIGITSYLVYTDEGARYLDFYNELREAIASRAKWGLLMATLVDDQNTQINQLRTRGWRLDDRVKNPKTGNVVNVLVKQL